MSPSPHYQDDAVTLWHGDALDVLRQLPDCSVDSVVTDPPYSLAFMSREWDRHDSPLDFQKWCQAWAEECLRVLKPGGHLLAFGGSRTWHRLACAVEDAGFEIRDSIAWLYGCHDDRTEVLTRRGWVNGIELDDTDEVAQWATDGAVSLVKPTARQRYTYDGVLIAFRNADVDQLVTPNHRVYRQVVERKQVAGKRTSAWSDWRVDQAADVNRWQPMRLPAAGEHDGPGIGGTDYAALLGWVWAEGGFDNTGSGVRVYQSSTNQPFVDEIAALFDRLGAPKRYDYQREWKGRPYTSTTWFISGDLANRVRGDLPGKSPTFDLLWRMTADEKRALWDAAMKGDGSKAARSFWQQNRDDLEWAQALLAGIGCRGKIADDPRGVMHWTDRSTVELQARHLAIEPVHYLGEVWCVAVPSGAFIVRRNGRVSVSGNSGFPKSLDVSKAIDKRGPNPDAVPFPEFAAHYAERRKAAGMTHAQMCELGGWYGTVNHGGTSANWEAGTALPTVAQWEVVSPLLGLNTSFRVRVEREEYEREVVGHRKASPGVAFTSEGASVLPITAPATPDARTWQGWGTAMKPAFEPIVVARKPLQGNVAANVLAHGTGALNIDACRVGMSDADRQAARVPQPTYGVKAEGAGTYNYKAGEGRNGQTFEPPPAGRWPANVVLDESQAAALDAQSGVSVSPSGVGRHPSARRTSMAGGVLNAQEDGSKGFGDSGGASRFFPTFRYEAKAPTLERPRVQREDGTWEAHSTVKPVELMRWLVRLVTPPTTTALVCSGCGYDSQSVRRVRADVPTSPQGTSAVQPDVSAASSRSSQESAAASVPDVRDTDQGPSSDVLLGAVPRRRSAAPPEAMPAVRAHLPAGSGEAEVLLEGVRGSSDGAAPASVRVVRQGVPTDLEPESLLQPDLFLSASGGVSPPADVEHTRLHPAVGPGSPDGDAVGIHPGTSVADGRAPGTGAGADRGSAPPQRDQDGQPPRESGSAPEVAARPTAEAATEADRLPPLRRADRDNGGAGCPECGSSLTPETRPGVVLDMFAGSGTTAEACVLEHFRCITVEREADYLPLIVARLTKPLQVSLDFDGGAA